MGKAPDVAPAMALSTVSAPRSPRVWSSRSGSSRSTPQAPFGGSILGHNPVAVDPGRPAIGIVQGRQQDVGDPGLQQVCIPQGRSNGAGQVGPAGLGRCLNLGGPVRRGGYASAQDERTGIKRCGRIMQYPSAKGRGGQSPVSRGGGDDFPQTLAPAGPRPYGPRRFARRMICVAPRAGSSAVEHPTFNRVVVGSIPPGLPFRLAEAAKSTHAVR